MLAFLVFIPAAVLHTNVTVDTGPINNDSSLPSDIISALDSTDTGTEWIMVVCWTAIFVQALAITLRFINLEPVEKYIGIVLIAVSGC